MVISRHITGKIRSARYAVEAVLIPFYLFLPWLRWEGHPWIRLDIPARKFYLLGNIFTPQEGYFLHLFLIGMGLSLFFFTTLIGRVWCGWACPQTVFTDLFDWIGRTVLGSKYGKKDAPTFGKAIVHFLWISVSLVGALAWISYFADPYEMINDIRTSSFWLSPPVWVYFTGFFTATLYADMAFVREQFCKYACPYARFQTVMMDADSVNVTYDFKRGEPRRKAGVQEGDCTACNLCLVVCPTGIDIREGVNVGCIACGKCADACAKTMGKEGKKTLIGYFSENQAKRPGASIRWIRPRSVVYGTLLACVLIAAFVLLYGRAPMYANVLPDRIIQPMEVPGGAVRNFYNGNLLNLTFEKRTWNVSVSESTLRSPVRILMGGTEVPSIQVEGNGSENFRIILETHPEAEDLLIHTHKISLELQDVLNPKNRMKKTVPFLIPQTGR
ncbi:cytochrome c oxidase accessory protein CcoG [Leptospira ellisii]|uniref:Cytochrome c oxidase accessory protein CcoG n=3 Tax=Leptospira ellisii TaxID=2023197 RepID=A0A2N0BCT3_9LEPT|nr:cytochrome c oxidase accessory protein CcoG [Leptospira ellisii]MDV6235359.1 cytochrome c oxidase accessory protein CcoG [Leptospira ellisii]PJZ94347.1 cytochrome c oxidase accessory protein CcoG [Leptospira ellisii]